MGNFKIGDVVVHKGIKMTVLDCFDTDIECLWFDKIELKREKFYPNQLVSLENWEKILQQKERDKKLESIFDVFNKTYRL